MKNTWTTPKLKTYPLDSNNEWYVWFRFNGGNPIRIKQGLNKIEDYNERLLEGEALAMVLEEKLKNGWVPKSKDRKLPLPYNNSLTAIQAYEKAYKLVMDGPMDEKSKKDYRTHYNYFIESLKKLKWDKSLFIELETYHFNVIVEEITKTRGKGNGYYNRHILLCKAFIKRLKDAYIIKENNALGIPNKPHKTKEKKLLTPEQQTKVIKHFNKVFPAFNIYLKTLYHTNIRPKELRLIKCEMLKEVIIKGKSVWYFDLPETITKNNEQGRVVIPGDLRKDLEKLDLSKKDYYLFGEKFEPSIAMQSINRANRLWRDEVKIKLEIDSNMYYLKSKSSNDKLRNGMTKEAVKVINRHSTEKITEIYATEHEFILMHQNIDKFGTFK